LVETVWKGMRCVNVPNAVDTCIYLNNNVLSKMYKISQHL